MPQTKPTRRLGANIDHVATIRQARQVHYPDPVVAAAISELEGADQITCHIRSDRRHIQDADLPRLRDVVQTQLNVEMAVTEEMMDLVIPILAVHPWRHRITLVPEREGEVTTEGGLNVFGYQSNIAQCAKRIFENKIHVSLFIDPDETQIRASVMEAVDMIEINTAAYAEGETNALERIKTAAILSKELGLEVAAGHGLTHHNLDILVKNVPEIVEYNIGHAIIARAIFVGLPQAIRDIKAIIAQ